MYWKLATLSLAVGLVGTMTSPVSAEPKLNVVKDVNVEERPDGTYVKISGSRVPTFSVFKLTEPLRLFVDVSNSEIGGDPQAVKVNNGVVSQVSLLEFKDDTKSVTRVIIGFDESAHYDVQTIGSDVVVFVDGAKRKKRSDAVAQFETRLKERDSEIATTKQKLIEVEQRYSSEMGRQKQHVAQTTSKLNTAKLELKQTSKELAALKAQLKRASGKDAGALKSRIADKNSEINGLRNTATNAKASLKTAKAETARLEKERKSDRAKIESLQARASKSEKERDAALALAKSKEQEGRKALSRAAALEKQLSAVQQRSNSDRELAAIKKQNATLTSEIKSLEKLAKRGDASSSRRVEDAKRAQASLNKKAAELENQRKANVAIKKSNSAMKSEIASLKKEINAERKRASDAKADRLVALKKAVSREKKRIASLTEARETASNDLNVEQRKLVALRAKRKSEEARLASLEKELSAQTAKKRRGQVAKAVAIDPTNAVRGIRLETKGGKSQIVVDLERPGQFETLPSGDSRAVMILNNVTLPSGLEKTLTRGSDGGAVRFVSSYRDAQGHVRLEAELDGFTHEVVRQTGNKLVWEFAPNVHRTTVAATTTSKQTRPNGGNYTSAPPRYPRVVSDPTQVSSVPGMRRRRLTIDLRDADIQNVLRLVAKEGGVNIVAGEGVSGTVTMRLKSVPLDEAFLTILQSRNLGFEKRGNVIRVAPQAVLREEESARAEAARAAAERKPLEVFLLPINYADAAAMEGQVGNLLSPRGTVSIDTRTNTLIIKDISENLSAIRSLVQNLDSQVPQVLIEARIVETNDTFQQQLGIQWGGDLTFSQANGNPTGLLFPSVLGIAGGATDGQTPTAGTSSSPNFGVNLPAPAGTGSGGALGLTLGSIGGALNISLRLSALEAAGHARIVSSPKILTLDNNTATISQGTSIPISVVGAAGVQTVFVDASLELEVRPHVTPDGNVQLRIRATKNEPDFQNTGARGDPTIIRKEAQTELLVKDGDTTVIGGIYTRNSGSSISAVPFFHKIPVLGWFFRTETESDRRTELLIFITPKIVNRAESLGRANSGSIDDGGAQK